MKVVVVHNLRRGGAWRRLRSQLDFLGDLDICEVTLSTAEPITETPVVIPLSLRADGVSKWLRPPVRYADLIMLIGAYRRLSRAIDQQAPDVVWANPCRYLQAPFLTTRGAPVVYYCDEPRRADYESAAREAMNSKTMLPYEFMRRAERALDRRSVRQMSTVLTNSNFTVSRIRAAYGRESSVVSCGVPDDFRPTAVGGASHVLSVGTMIPSKGHDVAIDAVAESGLDLPLLIISPRDEVAEHKRLQVRAEAAGVRLLVQCGVSESALLSAYRDAFATLYLARAEPLGLASLEAQACGSPVIVSDEGGLPETLLEGESGWAVARDAASAAAALRKLSDENLRMQMSAAAAAHGATHRWSGSAANMRLVLEAAVER